MEIVLVALWWIIGSGCAQDCEGHGCRQAFMTESKHACWSARIVAKLSEL